MISLKVALSRSYLYHGKRTGLWQRTVRLPWYRYGRESATFKFINVSQWYDYHSIHSRCTLWGPYDWATLFKLISVHFVLNTLLLLIARIFYTTNSNSKSNFTEFSKLFRLFRTMQAAPSTIYSHYTLQALLLSQCTLQRRKTCLFVCQHKGWKRIIEFYSRKKFGKIRCVDCNTYIRYYHCNL